MVTVVWPVAIITIIVRVIIHGKLYQTGTIQRVVHHQPRARDRLRVVVISIIAVVVCGKMYHLGIIQRVVHQPRVLDRVSVVVISIIAVMVCGKLYQTGTIQRVVHQPRVLDRLRVVVISIIAVVVCSMTCHLGTIQRVVHQPRARDRVSVPVQHIAAGVCRIVAQPRPVAGPVALAPDGPATSAVMNTVTQPASAVIVHRDNCADTPSVEAHGHPRQQNIPHSVRIRGHMYRAVVLI